MRVAKVVRISFQIAFCRTASSATLRFLAKLPGNFLNAVPDAAARFKRIPFAAIYGMRNQLSHGYFAIDLDVVWKVIERDIPNLRTEPELALAALDTPSTD
jgi:uncharacterized protein with HEPN domain